MTEEKAKDSDAKSKTGNVLLHHQKAWAYERALRTSFVNKEKTIDEFLEVLHLGGKPKPLSWTEFEYRKIIFEAVLLRSKIRQQDRIDTALELDTLFRGKQQ